MFFLQSPAIPKYLGSAPETLDSATSIGPLLFLICPPLGFMLASTNSVPVEMIATRGAG